MSSYLTKYLLRDFNACPTLFYQKFHHPEAFPSADDFATLQGREFEKMVKRCARFANLKEIPYAQNDEEGLRNTVQAIQSGSPLLAEASFRAEKLFARADIVEIKGQEITLYEIKSKSQNIYKKSGTLNEDYLTDVTFQYHLLLKAGYRVNKVYLCHPNGDFRRHGEIDPDEFVAFDDVTAQCRLHEKEVEKQIDAAFACAQEKAAPEHHFNAGCGDCPLKKTCFDDFGADNISSLIRANYQKKEKLAEQGIHTFADLLSHHSTLDPKQQIQVESVLSNTPHIDVAAIRKFMAGLDYPNQPLYFLDFETLEPCIPDLEGFHANKIYPTQYSLHKLGKDYGSLEHSEFLGDGIHDPRRALAEQLCEDLKEPGKILIYNKAMEPKRIDDFIALYPDLRKPLTLIRKNMVDLMDVFNKLYYYEKAFGSRYSIKVVLPAFYPNDPVLDYHALPGSQNGDDAQIDYYRLRMLEPKEKETVRSGMLRYCHLDTFAEIKVYLRLLKEIGDPKAAKIETIVSTYLKNRRNE